MPHNQIYPECTRLIEKQFDITGFFSAYKFDWDEKYAYKGECHTPWEIVFVKSGSVECTEDERVYALNKNDIIIHAPMEFHSIRSLKSSPSVMVASFFVNGKLPNEITNGVFSLNEGYSKEFTEIFERIYTFYHTGSKNDYSGQEVASRLSALLIRLGNKTAEENLSMSPSALEYRRIATFMADNVSNNLSLEQIASACSISVSYIKLLFKKYASISPMNFYANLRIQSAINMMKSGLSASEIAYTMNFSSPNYFSVFFKKHTGEVPSQYRKHLN